MYGYASGDASTSSAPRYFCCLMSSLDRPYSYTLMDRHLQFAASVWQRLRREWLACAKV